MAPERGSRDPRWGFLEDAKPALLAALGPKGVKRIDFVASFPALDNFAVWLGTATDNERDALPSTNPLLEAVNAILLTHGFTPELLTGLPITAQSQETVDRDYLGRWFYALR